MSALMCICMRPWRGLIICRKNSARTPWGRENGGPRDLWGAALYEGGAMELRSFKVQGIDK